MLCLPCSRCLPILCFTNPWSSLACPCPGQALGHWSGPILLRKGIQTNLPGQHLIDTPILSRGVHMINPSWALNSHYRASLEVQWLRICLPIQGTRVWALVQEDPTCHRATKSVRHNYWACALEPTCHNYWAHVPQLLSPRATTTEARTPRARAL